MLKVFNMAFLSSVKSSKAVSSIIVDTKAALEGMQKVAPAGIWFLESDTGVMKVSDGVSLYSALPNKVEALFTSSFKTLLDNANSANGVAKLDAAGKLTMGMLPDELTSTVLSGAVKYVADIAARDAMTDKGGLVIVVDASADATVAAGTAGYSWNGSAWTKVFESESMDVSLADYFAMSVNTLDDVKDGTTYVRMAATWKASVDSDLADLKGRLTTAEATLVTHGTDIATAQAAAEAAQGAADAAQGDIDAHKEQYATDKAALEAAIATADGKGAQGIADAAAAKAIADQNALDIDALEADTHTHANKGVLDGITADQVTAWDGAEAAAKSYADGIVATEKGLREAADSALDGRVTTVEGLVGKTAEEGLRKSVADNAAAIETLEGVVDTLSGGTATDLTDLKNRMTAVEGVAASNTILAQQGVDNAATAQAAAEAAQAAADQAQGEVDAVEGRMDTAEGEIDVLQANAFQTTDTIYFAPMSASELEAVLA